MSVCPGLYVAYYGSDFDFDFAFLCVSEHFKSIETHFFFLNFCERKAQNVHKRSEQDASANMLRQTVTLATAIFLLTQKKMIVQNCNVLPLKLKVTAAKMGLL